LTEANISTNNANGRENREIKTQFVHANGLDFETLTCGTGDKLALCLHGFPEHAFSWRYQLPLLAELGYTAWAPNLRGYGRSSRPPGVKAYALPALLADVAGLIDAAGARSTLLIGHDWGGAIAWMMALQALRPLEGLVVMNMPHPALFLKGLRSWRQVRRSWYAAWFQLPWLPEFLLGWGGARPTGELIRRSVCDRSRFPDEVLAVFRQNASQPGALTAMLNYYRANFRFFTGRMSPDQRQVLDAVLHTPTLMIWGEEDVALGKELTRGTEQLVSDFSLRYLPGVSHWVQQEAPEAVNAILAAWLQGEAQPQVGSGG
jgi:pimeloyl-ACP methyl ester carboxylesterase